MAAYADRVRVLRCPTANLSRSRNIGLLAARGDIAAYIDDDAVPCRTWLAQLAQLFANPRLDATGGIVYSVHPNAQIIQQRIGVVSSLAEQIDVRTSWLQDLVPPSDAAQWTARPMGVNMAFRRQALLDIGGFDEFYIYISEEADVALRLAQAGKIVHPVREAAMYHVPASSRNRTIASDVGRFWRLATRAQTYYAIKNGPPSGDPWRTIAHALSAFEPRSLADVQRLSAQRPYSSGAADQTEPGRNSRRDRRRGWRFVALAPVDQSGR